MEPGSSSSRCRAEGESQDERGDDTSVEVIKLDPSPDPAPPPHPMPARPPSFFPSSSGSGITYSAGSQSSSKKRTGRRRRGDRTPATAMEKEHLLDKVLTPTDVEKRLIIRKEDAFRFFPPEAAAEDRGKGALLSFEDPKGNHWSFRCSYSRSGRRYSMTKQWIRFVKKNGLHAGDTVSFYSRGGAGSGQGRFFVDWKLRPDPDAHHRSLRLRKQPPMATPSWKLAGPCSASSIRRLSQLLARVRTTISPSSGALVSFAWLSNVKSLAADAEDCLQDLHYRMMLAIHGVGNHSKVRSSASFAYTPTRGFFQSASPVELTIVSIANKLEFLRLGRPELSIAASQNSSKLFSVNRLVVRCILLCRGILGIMNIGGAEAKAVREVPLFASDDLTTYGTGRDKVTMIDSEKLPTQVTDPIYLLPTFIRSLIYLDLSSCCTLAQVPPTLCTLHNLTGLNLSRCYSLHTLPASLGMLHNLQILVLSNCQKLQSLPASLCELSKLRLLDLSGCSNLETLPYSFVTLRHIEILNLSDCTRLKELPQPFGILQGLKYLNLSSCHGLDLDVECKLANLMCATLSPHNTIHGFSDSFRDLAKHLDMSKWWKKNRVHPQCNTKATSFHTHKSHEQSIIERLLSVGSNVDDATSDHAVTYICVVGESGIGKTELVHRIYNDQLILDTFDLRIWVPTCDKKRLLGRIVEFASCSNCCDSPISVLEEILIEELAGKRFLLVLDDFDDESPYFWNELQKLFDACLNGSAVILTTKRKEVANHFGAMQTCYLSSLSKEDCFMIFHRHVLGGLDMNNYPALEDVGCKVVEKCGGNALCMKSLSGLLCHSEIGLSQIDMLVEGILPALRLCYDLLPSHLQKCFKFCSLFPKDYTFIKHHTVRLWVAQGFVFPEEGNQPEETGRQYFEELFCRSFFQHSPCHIDTEDKFVMHELFHDLADSVSKDECFRSEEPFCSFPENITHLSLVPSDFKTVALTKEIRNLQSLLVVRRYFPVLRILHLDDLYVKYRFLKALNLSSTDILQLPSSIQNMKHLRFLALNNTKIKGLPFEIGQVGTLQTLELKDCCHLTELPGSTSNLIKLRHLDVQKEPGNLRVSMPHGIGQLTDLQTLTVFNIGSNLLQCSIVELKNLNGLMGHVHITGLENIKRADNAREANIVGKHFLEALTLEWSYSDEGMDDDLGKEIANDILQNLQPSSNIMELAIRNYTGNLFPFWIQGSYLCNLVSLTLDNCHECSDLPYLGDMPSLKSLFIQRMNAVESFGIDFNPVTTEENHPPRFPSLEVLTLWEMYDLQFWIGTREGDFPRICRLSISRCPKLINLPPLLSLVHLSLHCGGQVPSFSELPSLESLKIQGFHKIQSVTFPHQLKMLKKLEISDCKELSTMFAYSLLVSDLKVVRCLKLDLAGSLLEDHLGQKVVGGRNSPTRRSMVLKTETYMALQDDSWKWEKHGEKNMFGSNLARSYYRCLHRHTTGCCATKILEPNDNDPNMMSAMYIYEHNHEFPNEPHLELSTELGRTRKRKESDVSSDGHTSKRQLN